MIGNPASFSSTAPHPFPKGCVKLGALKFGPWGIVTRVPVVFLISDEVPFLEISNAMYMRCHINCLSFHIVSFILSCLSCVWIFFLSFFVAQLSRARFNWGFSPRVCDACAGQGIFQCQMIVLVGKPDVYHSNSCESVSLSWKYLLGGQPFERN